MTATHAHHSRGTRVVVMDEDQPIEEGFNPLTLLNYFYDLVEGLLALLPHPRSFRVTYTGGDHRRSIRSFHAWTRAGARAEVKRMRREQDVHNVQLYLKI